jgi:carbonic anhydrase
VKSAIKNPEVPGQISALFPAILPAVYVSKTRELDDVIRTNALVQAATLMNASTVVEAAVKAGSLKVVPAVYDVGTGKVELLSIPAMMRTG